MSGNREFNLFTQYEDAVRQGDFEAEDCLCFSRAELSRGDDGSHWAGLDITFTVDNTHRDEETGFYEIFQTSSKVSIRDTKREKVDKIRFCYCYSNTDELRDLADWLMREADEIDREKELMST